MLVAPLPLHACADSAQLADLLMRLGRLLLAYGCSTHRLEYCLRYTAERHGCAAEVFAVPTGLWMSLTDADRRQHVRLVRVERWVIALDRLAALDAVFNAVADGSATMEQAGLQLDHLEMAPPRYGPLALVVAGALASGSAAVFFGGGPISALIGGSLGAATVALGHWMQRATRTRLLVDFIAGALVGGVAWLATALDPSLSRRALVLAGLIVNVPGLTLTAGLSEVAWKNLVSGAARLLDAVMILLALMFGVVAMAAIEGAATPGHTISFAPTATAALWAQGGAALVSAVAFAVLFSVAPRDAPGAMLTACLAWAAALGVERLGVSGPAAAFIGALVCGLQGNLFSRLTDRPAQVTLVPGIVILVPGAFGFVSVEQMLWGDVTAGAAGMMQTTMVAGALVIGLLLANAALPSRKFL